MLVLPLDVLCEASVCAFLVFFYAPFAFFRPIDGRHEPSSAPFGVLTACFAPAILLKMLALSTFVVVAVFFNVGLADPQLSPWIWGNFDGRRLLVQGHIFEPDAWSSGSLASLARKCGDGCNLFTVPLFVFGLACDGPGLNPAAVREAHHEGAGELVVSQGDAFTAQGADVAMWVVLWAFGGVAVKDHLL